MMDPGFNEAAFRDQVSDLFFRIQAAWTGFKLEQVKDILTQEMYDVLATQAADLKARGRQNRLENVAVRGVEMSEAWQEQDQDFISVRFTANLLDYVVETASGQVVEGSDSQPVKFEEYWTFTRPVGPGPWRLAAITQMN